MNEIIYDVPINIVEDTVIVLALSLSVTNIIFTIVDYYKPRILVDLGNTMWLY